MYCVKSGEQIIQCTVRGKVKKDIEIYVGDYVEISDGIIEDVYTRKNCLIRPYIANLDTLFIVIAPVPAPDWNLVEKLILNCYEQKIIPVIVYNKSDLINNANEILEPYSGEIKTIIVSAKTKDNIEELKRDL